MRKLICYIFVFILTINSVYAESIDKMLTKMGINKGAISVVIKNTETGDTVYSLNSTSPMNPASTLKVITSSAALDTLGADYTFKTQLYKSTNNDLYFSLSGDPLLKNSDIEKLILVAKDKKIVPKNVYIDDSAFDKDEWGEGWQWDDELNPSMPKFSIYNLNKNLMQIEVAPNTNGTPATLTLQQNYPITLMNYVNTNKVEANSINVVKNTEIPNSLNVIGNVSKTTLIDIPVRSPRLNFILNLENIISKNRFEYYSKITSAKLPKNNIYLVAESQHGIIEILEKILKNSDNLAAETLYKAAGATWAASQGSQENSTKMLMAYFNKLQINAEDIKVVDGSGVSKNNLMTAEFMTDFLTAKAGLSDYEEFSALLPAPSEGTLKNRMLYFKDNLRAKTGTLSDTSAIAGYIKTKRGKLYAFDIMIQDAKTSNSDKKNIEEQILRNVYMNY